MNRKQFFKETSILAFILTAPPLALLYLLKAADIKPLWLVMIFWSIVAISWMALVTVLYYRKSLKKGTRQSQRNR